MLELQQRKGEQERIMKDVNDHALIEKQKREERAQKIKDYAEQIKKQSEIPVNKFAKTGVAIVKN